MRIAGNSVIFPQAIVTNDDICRHVRSHTKSLSGDEIRKAISETEKYLDRMGANLRHWLAATERPFDLLSQAYEIAVENADIDKSSIDNVIYCGVDRVLLEPANAALIAAQLKLPQARAFDISHACQGWFTALQISGDRADMHGETSLILTAEFPMTRGGVALPKNFDLADLHINRWKLSSFLLGEAAAATIVRPGGAPLRYGQQNNNFGYRASYVRLPQAERFLSKSEAPFDVPELTFYAEASNLLGSGLGIGFDVMEKFGTDHVLGSTIIPHTISSRLLEFLQHRYRRRLNIVDIFPDHGNVGSTSLAAGLQRYFATNTSTGTSGQVLGWMVASGMTASVFEFPLSGKAD